jgi:hypothetical protein
MQQNRALFKENGGYRFLVGGGSKRQKWQKSTSLKRRVQLVEIASITQNVTVLAI